MELLDIRLCRTDRLFQVLSDQGIRFPHLLFRDLKGRKEHLIKLFLIRFYGDVTLLTYLVQYRTGRIEQGGYIQRGTFD